MTELPEPLTPPECDLRGLEWMPLYGDRLFSSETWLMASPEARCAALALWWAAWKQTPAASLADDDRVLAQLAGYGMAIKAWRAIRDEAMRGFVKCSDGRLYHPVVAALAREAWDRRIRDRDRKARWRKGREEDEDVPGRGQGADGDGDKTRERRGQDGDVRVPSASRPRSVTPDRTGQDRKEKEIPSHPPSEGRVSTASPAARPPTGTRLPDDWQPDDEAAAFAAGLGLDPPAVAARFRDYWHAKPGKDGRKLDWAGTWRNWCRRDAEQRPPRGHAQPDGGKLGWIIASMQRDAEDGDTAQRRLIQ